MRGIRLGLILAAVVIAVGAWFDWTYHAIRTEIAELKTRLPSVAELDQMSLEETTAKLKTALADCQRVEEFEANWIVRAFKAGAVATLAQHCELIEARAESLEGP